MTTRVASRAPTADAAAPADARPQAAPYGGLAAFAGSTSNATIARAVLARQNEGQPAGDGAGGGAASAVDQPLDYALGFIGQAVSGRLKKGEKKEWEARQNFGGDTWSLPRIQFPLGPILRGYIAGEATAKAGIGARGTVAANREDAGGGNVKDTLTITGNANVTGGLSGGLRAGLAAGIPQVLEARAGVSGKIQLDGKGTMDINATATRTGPGTGAGGWTSAGKYGADIDGAITASLKGEITLTILWWDKTLASFNISNWSLGKARVHIDGQISTTGAPTPPKVTWFFNPPEAPKAQHTQGKAEPPPKPAATAAAGTKRYAANESPPPPDGGDGPKLARTPEGQQPDGGGGGTPAPAAAPDGQAAQPAPAGDPGAAPGDSAAATAGPTEASGPDGAEIVLPGEEPKVEMP